MDPCAAEPTPDHDAGDAEPLVIHASLRGMVAAIVAPLVVLLLGGRALVVAGPTTGATVTVGVGLLLAVLAARQVPRHTVFDRRGVTRVCLGRRQRWAWAELAAIERTRPGIRPPTRTGAGSSGIPELVPGGLLARGRGRRRWLLTDRAESRAEYDRLETLVGHRDPAVDLRASRPPEGVLPTDLYRPRRGSRSVGRTADVRRR